ncbi:MAG: 23S rRNA (adenine(2503)-C(2))-methyltransferase RlmN, partial [Acidimicrobiales bacterium]
MSRYDLTEQEISELLAREPGFRAHQLFTGMHQGLRSPEELIELPAALRAELAAMAELAPAFDHLEEVVCDRGETRRIVLSSRSDRVVVEAVLMRYRRRVTACVSSQAGCAMNCSFCATGQMGFMRQLSLGEIVEQVVVAARSCE